MASKDVTLLQSFSGYVLDVKPYHTKIKQFLSELFFEDSFNVNIVERLNWDIYHQNVWTRDDPGGYRLQRLCEGYNGDRTFRIPAAVWPRFSLSDYAGQTPPGDDPPGRSVLDATQTSPYIHPDDPLAIPHVTPLTAFNGSDWNNTASSSYTGIPGRFRIPFHQGSRVYLDGVQLKFGSETALGDTGYVVDSTRSFIQLVQHTGDVLVPFTPLPNSLIDVQLFRVDRIFIAYNLPFDYSVSRDYDGYGYDILPYDSNEVVDYSVSRDYDGYGYDILPYDSNEVDPGTTIADYFEFTISSSYPEGYSPVAFFNSVPQNLPKAGIEILGITGAIEGEVWRITAIGPWQFKVQKKMTPGYDLYGFDETSFDDTTDGTISYATFKQVFDNGQISFVIDRVWCNYYIVPDNDSYDSYDLLDFDQFNFSGPLDVTDFLPSLQLKTEHGVVTDPEPDLHRPMEFGLDGFVSEGGYDTGEYDTYLYDEPAPVVQPPRLIAKVKKITQNMIPGPLDYYAFVLNEIPTRGTYVELRVEQNGQLNPWLNATIADDMYLDVTYTSPPGTKKIHNVMFVEKGNVYEESQAVNELILYHGRGAAPSSVLVEHNGVPISMSNVSLGAYFEGAALAGNTVGTDKTRVIVSLTTPQTIKVTLTF